MEAAACLPVCGTIQTSRTLYARPVLCCVYQLRRDGQRLSPEEVKQTKALGYLTYGKRGGHPVNDAKLRDSNGDLLLEMEHATLAKIERGGILLRGMERVEYQRHVRQAWWVLPVQG